ncbi:hypothetical protein [Fluviispira vulneris]|uniref:hypothetical protein n=1 Tax=Fluviispira vulneris TaxID=2763012 RepID=UPI0016454BF2|nr:hypothetical protein [Fluviispira vulneris]
MSETIEDQKKRGRKKMTEAEKIERDEKRRSLKKLRNRAYYVTKTIFKRREKKSAN